MYYFLLSNRLIVFSQVREIWPIKTDSRFQSAIRTVSSSTCRSSKKQKACYSNSIVSCKFSLRFLLCKMRMTLPVLLPNIFFMGSERNSEVMYSEQIKKYSNWKALQSLYNIGSTNQSVGFIGDCQLEATSTTHMPPMYRFIRMFRWWP